MNQRSTPGSPTWVTHNTSRPFEVCLFFFPLLPLLLLATVLSRASLPRLENNICGDVLCMLDAEGLKALGIATVGQRLAILKAVYLAKIAYNVPIEADDYVPPCEPS